jgi:hypothetical protein
MFSRSISIPPPQFLKTEKENSIKLVGDTNKFESIIASFFFMLEMRSFITKNAEK